MNILINATNLSGGGGAQVADSVCRYLNEYPQHHFTAVLSEALDRTAKAIEDYPNVEIVRYNYPPRDFKSFFTGRNDFLDNLVKVHNIQCVMTVFGPMKWVPRCAHVSGFALSQIVIPESPFFTRMPLIKRLKARVTANLWAYIFIRSAKFLYTENPLITERLQKKFKKCKVFTITNNYNQVFDEPDKWIECKLPAFDGVQLLSVTSAGGHKNLPIALETAKILREKHPDFKFRFVFTVQANEFPIIPEDLKSCFYFTGKVGIAECPSLYDQCDIEFQSTLLECFTATYPEAMVMRKPIITTDLEFAKGICGDAAVYYEATSPKSAADAVYTVASDRQLQATLVANGLRRLEMFDTSKQRVDKIIELSEKAGDLL